MRNNLKAHVGDVDAAAVPCGFGRAIGNKVWLLFFVSFLINWAQFHSFKGLFKRK